MDLGLPNQTLERTGLSFRVGLGVRVFIISFPVAQLHVRRHEHAHPNSTAFLAMGSDRVRAAARQLLDRHAPCWSSRTSGDGCLSRRWRLGICRLGFPFLWQPFLGSVTALARDSRLVHRGRVHFITSVMRSTPPNKSLQPTPGSALSSAARFTSFGPAWLSSDR